MPAFKKLKAWKDLEEVQVRYFKIARRRDQLIFAIARHAEFRMVEVKKADTPEEAVCMGKIGTVDGNTFFWSPEEEVFYVGEASPKQRSSFTNRAVVVVKRVRPHDAIWRNLSRAVLRGMGVFWK